MGSPLEKPEGLNWDAAAVELPPVPMLPPGADAMSMTIAGVLPTLTTPLTASVAALSAKENMFSGKLGAAESAYQNADDSGQQSVGQLTSMLGQVGQMAQQAGGPAQALGGQTSMFGQMMQQAMQAAQGAGSQGGSSGGSQGGGTPAAGGQSPVGQAPAGVGVPQQPTRDDAGQEQAAAPGDTAAPGDSAQRTGPAPAAPHEHPRHGGGNDLARRM
jgi:hypothetical protein